MENPLSACSIDLGETRAIRRLQGGPQVYMMMCRDCGEFVVATKKDGELEPVPSSCPECGGSDFTDVRDGERG